VQWLGELWRKYHQVFVLIDDQRLQDVEKDFGPGMNPFEVHARVVVSLEMLEERPHLTDQAVEAGIDLLIVDEAHHLRRRPGHPGNPAYRSVAPITAEGRHVLLLTATPLEDDAQGFFRLLQLLRPEEFPEDGEFEDRLAQGRPLPPCTSSTRREEIGGLPPRKPVAIDLEADQGWESWFHLEQAMRALPVPHALARRNKLRKIRRALASGASLAEILDPGDKTTRKLARKVADSDPRLRWLASQAPLWRQGGDRTLIFVAHRESLEQIKAAMSRTVHLRVGLFHEELSPAQRDIEVAQFRLASGPSILVSTECGGEGRNFEFCTRLVLFDLPWNPMVVEQRIGRLDRIGRRIPVEIVYFRPPGGVGAAVANLYESLQIFNKPLGGVERELAGVEPAIDELALSELDLDGASHFKTIVDEARRAYDRVQEAAYDELHREPYRSRMADAILERVPTDLDELTEEVTLAACDLLHLHIEEQRGNSRYSIEFGTGARVENLPGVPGTASFLGTFDREEAVRDESIDFYASGHPFIEGVLAHLEDSHLGRVTLLDARGGADDKGESFGLLAVYKDGPQFEAVALDVLGNERPDWARRLTSRPLRTRRVKRERWTDQPGWQELVRSLAARLEDRGRPVAVAAFRIGP